MLKFPFNYVGTFLGCLGIVICFLSLFSRWIGDATLFDIRAINVFVVGTGFIVMGCFAKLCGR